MLDRLRRGPWPWTLKTSKQKLNLVTEKNWRQNFNKLGHVDLDRLKRLNQTRLQAWARFSFLLAVVSVVCLVIMNEVTFHLIQENSGDCVVMSDSKSSWVPLVYCCRFLLTAASALMFYARVQYYHALIDRRVIHGTCPPDIKFLQSEYSVRFFIDVTGTVLHCPIGVDGCFEFTALLGDVAPTYQYSYQIVSLVCLFRIYLIYPVVVHNNRFETSRAHMMLKLYGIQSSQSLPFRDFLSDGSISVVFCAYVTFMFFFAYLLVNFERPIDYAYHFPMYLGANLVDTYWVQHHCLLCHVWQYPSYAMCLCSYRYHGRYPLSVMGRVVSLCANCCGMITTALLLAAVISTFAVHKNEQKVRHTLDYMNVKRQLPDLASSLITNWFRSNRPEYKKAFSRSQLQFSSARQFLLSQHPGNSLAHVQDVYCAVQRVEDNQAVIMQELLSIRSVRTLDTHPSPPTQRLCPTTTITSNTRHQPLTHSQALDGKKPGSPSPVPRAPQPGSGSGKLNIASIIDSVAKDPYKDPLQQTKSTASPRASQSPGTGTSWKLWAAEEGFQALENARRSRHLVADWDHLDLPEKNTWTMADEELQSKGDTEVRTRPARAAMEMGESEIVSSRSHSSGKKKGSRSRHNDPPDTGRTFDSRLDTGRTYDSRLDTGRTYDSRLDTGRTYDSRLDTGRTYDSRLDTGRTYDSRLDTERTYDSRLDTERTYDSRLDTERTYDSRLDTGRTFDSRLDTERTYDSRLDTERTYDSRLDTERTYDSRLDTERTYDSALDTDRSYVNTSRTDDSRDSRGRGRRVRDVQIEMDIVSRRPRSHRDRTRKKKFVLQHDTVREEDEENWVESEVESVSRRNLPSVPTT